MHKPVIASYPARRWFRSLVAACLLSGAGVTATAAQTAPSGASSLRSACMDDYQRYCASVSRGGGRVRQCMHDNAERLSPPCRDALKASEAARTGGSGAR